MSVDQKKFLKKERIKKLSIIVIQFLIILSLFVTWEFLANKGYINTFIYSSPSKIVKTLISLVKTHGLFIHIISTINELIMAFLLGTIMGILIAIILYQYPILAKIFEPFLVTINSLPKVALGPLIIIIFGANFKSIIVMALFINLIITIMNLYNGFIHIDQNKLLLIKSFKATKWQILKYLILPGSIKTIISSLKINVSMTFIGVIMGEFLVSKQGIGYLIIYGTQIFNMNLVMTGIFVLVIMSIIIYKVVTIIELYFQK